VTRRDRRTGARDPLTPGGAPDTIVGMLHAVPPPADQRPLPAGAEHHPAGTGRAGPSASPTHLVVSAWWDPDLARSGIDPRGDYAERYWLGIAGPSTCGIAAVSRGGLPRSHRWDWCNRFQESHLVATSPSGAPDCDQSAGRPLLNRPLLRRTTCAQRHESDRGRLRAGHGQGWRTTSAWHAVLRSEGPSRRRRRRDGRPTLRSAADGTLHLAPDKPARDGGVGGVRLGPLPQPVCSSRSAWMRR
jgi:hypothetical protein